MAPRAVDARVEPFRPLRLIRRNLALPTIRRAKTDQEGHGALHRITRSSRRPKMLPPSLPPGARRSTSRPDRLTREAILEAGSHLFDKDGPEAVTLRGVARRAGVTPPALYRYFNSAAALLDAVTSNIAATVDQEVDHNVASVSQGVERLMSRASLLMSAARPSASVPSASSSTTALRSSIVPVPSQHEIELLRNDLDDARLLGQLRSQVLPETMIELLRIVIVGFRSVHPHPGVETANPLAFLNVLLAPYLVHEPMTSSNPCDEH